MIRKQIYLTEALDRQIHLAAATEKKPAAQVIREVLHVGFLRKIAAHAAGEALLGLARLGEELGLTSDDPHLSRNIAKYLYEDV
jgi:hypothetical protein